jgi:hypothetical protein|tara:strand:- start:1292 stop:1486 length:195 start_codon:yes stop_codon:yes gene_type:complete
MVEITVFGFIYSVIVISAIIFTIVQFIDVIASKRSGKEKVIWGALILFTGIFGAGAYYLLKKKK